MDRAWLAALLLLGCATGNAQTADAAIEASLPDAAVDAAIPDAVVPDATVMTACTPGSRPLGGESIANGTTTISLGAAVAAGAEPFLGASYQMSQVFQICVPDDAVSFVLMAPTGEIASFVSPLEGELIDGRTSDTYYASPAAPDDETLLHPASPTRPMGGGVYRFRVAWTPTASPPNVFVTLRRGAPSERAALRVNLVYVDTDVTAPDVAAIERAFGRFERIYAAHGIAIGEVGVGTLTDPSLLVIDDFDTQYGSLVRGELADASHLVEGAVNVYLVRELDTLLGKSSGIPGFVGYDREGVVVATATHRLEDGSIDDQDLGLTLAHEIGHFLGLAHTTELDGGGHDGLVDTPECAIDRDVNRDGELSIEECGAAGDNLMFWEGLREPLSDHQGQILRASPGVRASS